MFVGEAPGFHEDKQGVPFVGAAGQLLGEAARRDRPDARRRLRRERAEVPPSGEPRPAAGGDRGLREPPLPPDRADPAEGGRDARQLRDEAALRQADRDHAASTAASRRSTLGGTRVTALPDLPSRPRRSTRRGCSRCSRRTSRASRSCSAGAIPPPARRREPRRAPAAPRAEPRPARPLLAVRAGAVPVVTRL